MKGLFSSGSPFMNKLNDFADFIFVNLLYLVCCLPVFTIGAARSALYAVSFSYLDREETGVRIYLRAFRENFRAATPAWLLLLLCGLFLAFDFYVVITNRFPAYRFFAAVLAVLLVLYGMLLSQFFLVQARFRCGFRRLLGNSALIALAHPLRTAALLLLSALPWALLAFDPYLFASLTPVFVLLYFSLEGYLGARLMLKPFRKYAAENVRAEGAR